MQKSVVGSEGVARLSSGGVGKTLSASGCMAIGSSFVF